MVPSLGLLLSPLPPSLVFSQIPPLAPFRLPLSLPSLLSHVHSPLSGHHRHMCRLCVGFPPPADLPRVGANHSPPPSLHPVLLFSVFRSHPTTSPHGSGPCRHLSTVLCYFFLPWHSPGQAPGPVPTSPRRGYSRHSCEAGPQAFDSSRSLCPSLSGWAASFFPTWGSVTLLPWVPTDPLCYSRSFAA